MPEEIQDQTLPQESLPKDEFIDPGQFEGKPKPVKKERQDPEPGSERWTQIYAKYKDGERELEKLNARFAEQDKIIQGMRAHNEALAQSISENNKKQEAQTKNRTELESKSRLRELRQKKARALEEGNYAEVVDLEGEIDDIRFEQLNSQFSPSSSQNQNVNKEEIIKEVKAQTLQDELNSAINQFIDNSPWFDEKSSEFDPMMQAFAIGLSDQYSRTISNPSQRMRKIKEDVERQFNYNGNGKSQYQESNPMNLLVESSGGYSGSNKGNKTVTLSAEEKRIAHMMFPDNPNAEQIWVNQKKLTK